MDHDYGAMVEECEDAARIPKHNGGTEFTEWEERFLESIRERLDAGRGLTEKQEAVILKIHGKI